MNLVETSMKGDRLETLKALRRVLAETIQSTSSARETATLACQLRHVLTEIDDLEKEDRHKEDTISQILKKRRTEGLPGSVRRDEQNM